MLEALVHLLTIKPKAMVVEEVAQVDLKPSVHIHKAIAVRALAARVSEVEEAHITSQTTTISIITMGRILLLYQVRAQFLATMIWMHRRRPKTKDTWLPSPTLNTSILHLNTFKSLQP